MHNLSTLPSILEYSIGLHYQYRINLQHVLVIELIDKRWTIPNRMMNLTLDNYHPHHPRGFWHCQSINFPPRIAVISTSWAINPRHSPRHLTSKAWFRRQIECWLHSPLPQGLFLSFILKRKWAFSIFFKGTFTATIDDDWRCRGKKPGDGADPSVRP